MKISTWSRKPSNWLSSNTYVIGEEDLYLNVLRSRSLADQEKERPGGQAGCAFDWVGQVSLGTSLSNPGGGSQENQFNWEASDGDRMFLESRMTEDIDELLDPGAMSDIGDNGASIYFRTMASFLH